jgi:hypothetical protein
MTDSSAGNKSKQTKEFQQARERDLVFGSLVIIGSIALGIYANHISQLAIELMDAKYYTAPGFTLLVIAIGLLAMAIYLVINAFKAGARFTFLLPIKLYKRFKDDEAMNTILVFLYLFLYMIVFWENLPFTKIRIPFILNTTAFLSAIMFTFKVTRPRNILLISIITSVVVFVIFDTLIGVPLP